jgi:hypothetical protein
MVFLLALLLSVAPSAVAQSARHREVVRLSRKLWRVIDMTRAYVPQFQAHVILEAPDRERLTLTFRDARAQTLVRSDVIALAPQTGIPADIPETALGDYLIPTHVRLGKPRWWKEWVKQEGKQLKRDWQRFLEQKRAEETDEFIPIKRQVPIEPENMVLRCKCRKLLFPIVSEAW